jgi:hypothetical protein
MELAHGQPDNEQKILIAALDGSGMRPARHLSIGGNMAKEAKSKESAKKGVKPAKGKVATKRQGALKGKK